MGTHPSVPSAVLPVGDPLHSRLGRDLPFLIKVLSVAKPLSIQANPDKFLVEALRQLRPARYRDTNHKPEMAIAVIEFHTLFGFARIQELKGVIKTLPEVGELIGHEDASKIMNVKEYHGSSDIRTLTEKEQLILSLERQYPDDVGVVSALLLNHIKLSPGEAIYIGANEPHAYLSGECIECMATSDNVVRAGLTHKYRDVKTFCSMLTYNQVFPEILRGVPVQPFVRRYTPPCDEFEVDCCLLPPGEMVVMPTAQSPSIVLVLAGEGEIQVIGSMLLDGGKAEEGDVFCVPAHTEVKVSACGHAPLQIYRRSLK